MSKESLPKCLRDRHPWRCLQNPTVGVTRAARPGFRPAFSGVSSVTMPLPRVSLHTYIHYTYRCHNVCLYITSYLVTYLLFVFFDKKHSPAHHYGVAI